MLKAKTVQNSHLEFLLRINVNPHQPRRKTMKKLTSVLKQRKGMTLIETVITLLIAGILIAATGALIISGLNLFQDTAARNLDQQIGDNVLEIVREQILYSKSVTIEENVTSFSEDSVGTSGAIFVGTGPSTPANKGKLYIKRAGEDEEVFDVYPQDNFYAGRKLTLQLTVDKVKPQKALTLTVKVMDGDDSKYVKSTSFQLLNSSELDAPFAAQTWPTGGPAVIVFTPVE